MPLTLLILTGCQTMKHSSSVVCEALHKGEPIQYLSKRDIQLVREHFSVEGRNGQKMVLAIMKELKCGK